jgi:acetyl-CoA carboxylase/biotin carboxylase 1
VDAISGAARGDQDGLPVSTPYAVTSPFERRRALAFHITETVFVYDFLELFQRALEVEWDRYNRQAARASARSGGSAMPRPRRLLVARELVLRPRRPRPSASARGRAAMDRSKSSELFSNEMGGSSSRGVGDGGRGRGEESAASSQADLMGSPVPVAEPAPAKQQAEPGSSSSASDVWSWDVEETTRPPGQNSIAMVAWRVTMFTPEFPESGGGRDVYIIANDITVSAGSFGVLEDALFFHASRLAREAGAPRLFLAANSGARIGLAEEVKAKFRVAWSRPDDATKGFSYLYLSPEDHAELTGRGVVGGEDGGKAAAGASGAGSGKAAAAAAAAVAAAGEAASGSGAGTSGSGSSSGSAVGSSRASVKCRRVVEDGEERWVLDDIIGREDGLGVENLRGSGRIAGETSRSYRENFTLTYVTGRSVGIGAYLVRLGQRTIQKRTAAPILLTGFQALNKLIGAEVYTSNEQLGGPKIMYHNGVTHQVVDDDLAGVSAIMRWLAYVPSVRGASLPVSPVTAALDPVDRPIAFAPGSDPYDPRHLIAGQMMASSASAESDAAGEDTWTSGLFDRGSWTEYLAGWARTVVVGRARLGGIPIGVIIAETRTVSHTRPADPATPQSQETTVQQAGQVWFPDSASKTAQAIRDFAGEELPLMILANWRGFSGGQRDMFDEVLKFGSYIVDALTEYKQPVFVYIPPGGELRGGAWVVVDPTINEEVMEMYAAPTGRGGVLEPAGIASIKFKARDIRAAANRLDPTLQALAASARSARDAGDEAGAGAAEAEAEERLQRLTGVFTQISHHFADLHDRPGRMLAKGVIRAPIPWERARGFFYWRLRRRLAEFALRRRIAGAAPQIGFAEAGQVLRTWFESTATSRGSTVAGQWDHDLRVLQWLADSRDVLDSRLAALARESITEQVLSLGRKDAGAAVDGILALMSKLPVDQREAVMGKLRKQVLFGPAPGAGMSVDPLLAGLPGTR